MTEVALFTERREIVQVTDSAQIKERLMDTLRTITQAQAQDVDDTAADSLLAELAGPAIEPEQWSSLSWSSLSWSSLGRLMF
jgi:hypothetical protein